LTAGGVIGPSQVLVAEYTYNGLGYRTGWHYDVDGDASVEANTAGNTDDPWFQFVYDARWRQTATYRASHYSGWTIDANPKEQYVYNTAGVAGSGGSSYIDSVILRDRDANTAWEDSADATLEERTYYCQNWRADVIALMTDAGQLLQQVRYDPYGVPFGVSKADVNGDGSVNTTDITRFGTIWNGGSGTHPLADWNFDGSVNTADYTAFLNSYNNDTALGRGDLSYAYAHAGGTNRKGYAGYEIDPVLTGSEGWESVYHIRNRVYLSQLGRWTRRNPLGYVDGELMNLFNYVGNIALTMRDPTGLPPVPSQGEPGCGIEGVIIAGSECDDDSDDGPKVVPIVPRGPCIIELWCNPLEGGLGEHCYLVSTCDGEADEVIDHCRGGPSGPGDGGSSACTNTPDGEDPAPPDGWGPIETDCGPYIPGVPDYTEDPGAFRRTACYDADCRWKWDCVKHIMDEINWCQQPYSPCGPNSNTVIKFALKHCGMDYSRPSGQTGLGPWGWGSSGLDDCTF